VARQASSKRTLRLQASLGWPLSARAAAPAQVGKADWAAVQQGPPCAVDAWGLGCLMHEAYAGQPLARIEDLRSIDAIPKAVLPVRPARGDPLAAPPPDKRWRRGDACAFRLCFLSRMSQLSGPAAWLAARPPIGRPRRAELLRRQLAAGLPIESTPCLCFLYTVPPPTRGRAARRATSGCWPASPAGG